MNTEKILLVDDERAIRLAVRTALTREGMQVTEAADGSEALELLKKQQFHLVILDVMMEHVGGYDDVGESFCKIEGRNPCPWRLEMGI